MAYATKEIEFGKQDSMWLTKRFDFDETADRVGNLRNMQKRFKQSKAPAYVEEFGGASEKMENLLKKLYDHARKNGFNSLVKNGEFIIPPTIKREIEILESKPQIKIQEFK